MRGEKGSGRKRGVGGWEDAGEEGRKGGEEVGGRKVAMFNIGAKTEGDQSGPPLYRKSEILFPLSFSPSSRSEIIVFPALLIAQTIELN